MNQEFFSNFLEKKYERNMYKEISNPKRGPCIDNMLLKNETINFNSYKITNIFSYQFPLFATFKNLTSQDNTENETCTNLNKINYNKLKQLIENSNRQEFTKIRDPNTPIIRAKQQFRFIKNKSRKDALNNITNIIYNNLDKSKPLVVTFFDLATAFDTVDHKILLNKLEKYGIRASALDSLKSYLADRKQGVKLKTCSSDYCNIKREFHKEMY